MTKADLIEEVSRLAELTRKDSEVIVDTIFDSVVRSLRVGDKIEIRDLLNNYPVHHPESAKAAFPPPSILVSIRP